MDGAVKQAQDFQPADHCAKPIVYSETFYLINAVK